MPVRFLRPICLALAALVSVSELTQAQVLKDSPWKEEPQAAKYARLPQVTQEVIAPFWTLEPGWNTQLELRNNHAQKTLDVTPILRTSDGAEIELRSIVIPPDHVQSIDLQAAAPKLAGRSGSYGSLVLRFTAGSYQALYAAVLVQLLGHPISFHIDAYADATSFSVGSWESVWWLPRSDSNGFLITSNGSANSIKGREVWTEGGQVYSVPFSLGPHQTRRTAISDVVHAAGFNNSQGGVKVEFDSDAGRAHVSEFLFDEGSGFSAMMKIFSHVPADKPVLTVLRAPLVGLSVPDPMLGYPVGTMLHPTVLVRNATTAPLTASIVVNWKGPKGTGTIPLPVAPIAPEETRVLELSSLQKDGLPADANWANMTITYIGRDGDLIPIAATYDSEMRYGLQSPFTSNVAYMWEGGMWHADALHGTMITAGNAARKNTNVSLKLFYGLEDVYELPEHSLQPGEQMWVDVGSLIRNQVPDKKGRTIPPQTIEGSYQILDLNGPEEGMLFEGKVIADKTFGHAVYGCAQCCGFDTTWMLPDPIIDPVGGTDQCSAFGYNVCSDLDIQLPTGNAWSSSNSSIASITTGGLMTGVAAGTATITATENLPGLVGIPPKCPVAPYMQTGKACVGSLKFSGTANDFIFVGTDPNILSGNVFFLTGTPSGGTFTGSTSNSGDVVTLSPFSGLEKAVIQTTTQSVKNLDRAITFAYTVTSVPCVFTLKQNVTARQFAYLTNDMPSNQCNLAYGTDRTYTYTVYTHPDKVAVDANSGISGTPVSENFSPALKCNTITGSGSLNTNGQFTDHVSSGCSTSPLTCTQTSTQTLNVSVYPVRTNTLQWTSSGVTYTNDGPTQ